MRLPAECPSRDALDEAALLKFAKSAGRRSTRNVAPLGCSTHGKGRLVIGARIRAQTDLKGEADLFRSAGIVGGEAGNRHAEQPDRLLHREECFQ